MTCPMEGTMRRHLLILAFMAAAPLARADYQPTIGLYYVEHTLGTSFSGSGSKSVKSNPGVGILFGLDGGGGDRISLDAASFDLGNQDSLDLYTLNYDHFLSSLDGIPPELRFFVGGSVGYGKLDINPSGSLGGAKDSNISYGARLGADYRFTPQLSLELGVRYLYTDLKADLVGSGGTARFAVKDDTSGWLGLNYRF